MLGTLVDMQGDVSLVWCCSPDGVEAELSTLDRSRENALRVCWSVAEFVERRFAPAWRNGRADATNAGYAVRPVATDVRPCGHVAERRGHFLDAENASPWG